MLQSSAINESITKINNDGKTIKEGLQTFKQVPVPPGGRDAASRGREHGEMTRKHSELANKFRKLVERFAQSMQ